MKSGERQFPDGTTRPVYRNDDGRQYVLDDEGVPVSAAENAQRNSADR